MEERPLAGDRDAGAGMDVIGKDPENAPGAGGEGINPGIIIIGFNRGGEEMAGAARGVAAATPAVIPGIGMDFPPLAMFNGINGGGGSAGCVVAVAVGDMEEEFGKMDIGRPSVAEAADVGGER